MTKAKTKKKGYNLNKKLYSYTPLSIKFLSVIFYIFAFLTAFAGLALLIGGIAGYSLISYTDTQKIIDMMPDLSQWDIVIGQGIFATLGVTGFLLIGWGVIEALIGRGLWKGNKLAFIGALVLIFLGLFISLILVFSDFYNILIFVFYCIMAYLLLNKSARHFFDLNKVVSYSSRTPKIQNKKSKYKKKRR